LFSGFQISDSSIGYTKDRYVQFESLFLMRKIYTFPTLEVLIKHAAESFINFGNNAIQQKGSFSVALSGGSTPLPLYQILAHDPHANSMDWNKIHFFWGDERTVPPTHTDSNFGQANQSLLQPREVPLENVHRIHGELDPATSANKYQEEVLSWFKEFDPRFDLILLGLGADGHTASLFPGTAAVQTTGSPGESWVTANWVPQLDTWRITFTPRLINQASRVMFLVSGENKGDPLHHILEGIFNPDKYPAQLINPTSGELVWFIDHQAGTRLSDELV